MSDDDRAREHDAVANERRFVDVDSCRLEHRLELFAHRVIRSRDERCLAVIGLEQARGFLDAPSLDPARDDPSRMSDRRVPARPPDR